jgi:hypothetical protein
MTAVVFTEIARAPVDETCGAGATMAACEFSTARIIACGKSGGGATIAAVISGMDRGFALGNGGAGCVWPQETMFGSATS